MSSYLEEYSDDKLVRSLRNLRQDDKHINTLYLAEALARILERTIPPVNGNCDCEYDWTDGTGWCNNCGKERK